MPVLVEDKLITQIQLKNDKYVAIFAKYRKNEIETEDSWDQIINQPENFTFWDVAEIEVFTLNGA